MDYPFKPLSIESLQRNATEIIHNQWFLLTAGTFDHCNTMTANWGGLGFMWNKPVAFCVVRPVRHTFGFVEGHPVFSMSFLPQTYRGALQFCGAHSGRDMDKFARSGLSKLSLPGGSMGIAEADLILECKKLYFSDIQPNNFWEPGLEKFYPNQDYHRFYVAEIVQCWLK